MAMSDFRHMTTSLISMWFHLDSNLSLSHLCDWTDKESIIFKNQIQNSFACAGIQTPPFLPCFITFNTSYFFRETVICSRPAGPTNNTKNTKVNTPTMSVAV